MADLSVRALDEDDWQVYRDLRLAALQESPDAFVDSYETESRHDEQFWRERLRRTIRFVAERNAEPIGVVGLGLNDKDAEIGEIFSLWVAPDARVTHVAWYLVGAAAKQAYQDGRKRLYFWVGSENVPAIGFASNFGFRPTSERRPKRVSSNESDEDEVAMVMPLAADPSSVKNPFIS